MKGQQSRKGPIVRASDYAQDLYGRVLEILAAHRTEVRGKRVVLKPNLAQFDPRKPRSIRAPGFFMPCWKLLGRWDWPSCPSQKGRVTGAAHWTRRKLRAICEAIPGFEQVFTDPNVEETTRIPLSGRSRV